MSDDSHIARHSQAAEPTLISDPEELARAEAANGLKQFDLVTGLVGDWTQPGRKFKLRVSTILSLHRAALDGLSPYAGNFRPGSVLIGKSKHKPVDAHLVPELVEDMCDYVNDNWESKSAVHLAAYIMWRLNWIHPFADGNGRTSRAVSYLVLCVKGGTLLPGINTIPEQISADKRPYYEALEKADEEWDNAKIDVSELEALLGAMLANQLTEFHKLATGSSPSS